MEGSVLSFLKADWKVSDTGSAHWASSLLSNLNNIFLQILLQDTCKYIIGVLTVISQ
jgi:hypothetical protein